MRKLLTLWIVLVAIVGISTSSFAQVGGLMFPGPGTPHTSGGVTLTYTVTDVSQVVDTTNTGTFTVNIGTVAADRVVVILINTSANSGANGTPTSVTLNTNAMTLAASESSTGNGGIFVYFLSVPSSLINSTSATLQVNTPFSSFTEVVVGNLNGSATASVRASNNVIWSGGGTVSDPRGVPNDLAAVSALAGDIVVTGWAIDRTGSYSVNAGSATIDRNTAGGSVWFVAAHGTSGSPSFNGATNFNNSFAIVSFKP
jgi:hypothetical protein